MTSRAQILFFCLCKVKSIVDIISKRIYPNVNLSHSISHQNAINYPFILIIILSIHHHEGNCLLECYNCSSILRKKSLELSFEGGITIGGTTWEVVWTTFRGRENWELKVVGV